MGRLATIARICLTGPESTGKSELAARLAAEYGTVWVPEFAREYVLRLARELTAADVEPIASGQMAQEERLAAGAARLLLLDTDLVSTVVYARHYYGLCPRWIENAARARRADLYLLLDIDVPWQPDPARDAGHVREELFVKFAATLEELEARTVVISGDWDERARRARAAIEAVVTV